MIEYKAEGSSGTKFSSFLDLLLYRASEASGTADQPAFSYMANGDDISATLTYRELDLEARSLAIRLQAAGIPGDRVLIVMPPCVEYVVAFFACLYSGMVAVPAMPATSRRVSSRLGLIARDSGARIAVGAREAGEQLRKSEEDAGWCRDLVFITVGAAEAPGVWARPQLFASSPAFLQYTSGSTGNPKGVVVSHGNLLANVALCAQVYRLEQGDVLVSWLPPYHDFGLIGAIALPVFIGGHCVQFPPAAFVMRPIRWLKAITRFRAKMTGAPNFAYELAIRKIDDEQRRSLDLSSLRLAVNGAERVRIDTMRRFADAFHGCGFRPATTTPAYGLAECTLLVTANVGADRVSSEGPLVLSADKAALAGGAYQPAEGSGIELMAHGPVLLPDHRVSIVDDATGEECPEGGVGEIYVTGPSVSAGYWGRTSETGEAFLSGSDPEHNCVRTGDLGFAWQGQLFVTGRSKELLVLNGANLYPQDIEATVMRLDERFRIDACVAFAVGEGCDAAVVLLQEVGRASTPGDDRLSTRVRSALAEQHGIFAVAAILLLPAGQLPRTSSGKLQRTKARELFLAGGFAPLWRWEARATLAQRMGQASHSAAEHELMRLACEVLGQNDLRCEDNFLAMGGNSLQATMLLSKIRDTFDVELSLAALFESGSMAELATRIAAHEPCLPLPPISTNRGCEPPLSWAQQRLWFLDQLDHAAGAAYHIPAGLRLSGRLDRNALKAALARITARHEGLRTCFVQTEAGPVQRFAPPDCGFALLEQDLSALGGAEREEAVQRAGVDEAAAPFDLAQGPLIRGRLLRLAEEEHVLLVTQHHIVSDDWSIGILVREFTTLYTAFSQGQGDPLPPLTIQYADYALWQRQWLQGTVLQEQLDYWTEHLRGAPALLELPTDRPRPSVQRYAGGSVGFMLDADLTAGLRALAQRHGATLFMVLMAGWSALLARLSGQDDVVVGVPVANRQRAEVEPLIGFFVNTLAVRVRFDEGQSVAMLLEQVKGALTGAYGHQGVPFEQVVEVLKPARNLGHNPVFQAMLTLNNASQQMIVLPELAMTPMPVPVPGTQFDLSLSVQEQGGHLMASLDYASDLFDEATIARWAAQFPVMLAALANEGDGIVGKLPLVSAAECALLNSFNVPVRFRDDGELLHSAFERHAQAAPGSVAAMTEDGELSYGDLWRQARHVATSMQALGILPDDRVVLCVERGLSMLPAMLGISMAGGCYVPFDPAHPTERLKYMMDDAAPKAILASAALIRSLPLLAQPESLPCPLLDLESLPAPATAHPAPSVSAGNLAYIIYTSGSTGAPKGVMVEHRNVVNLVRHQIAQFELRAQDRVLQFASLGFDNSVAEIFPALSAGACLVLRPAAMTAPGPEFAQFLARHEVTVLDLPTAFWRQWAQELGEGRCIPAACVRLVAAGGEKAELRDLRLWLGAPSAQPIRWINFYGPTEATVNASTIEYAAGDPLPAAEVPIGRPVTNYRVYVLDRHLQPQPVGVTGELYIGGAGVARGYRNREALTRERFLPDPFDMRQGARMYRTGDLGRWRADGVLEYQGRNDFQVKLNGYRIELGEVETLLAQLPGVREAVVLMRDGPTGDKRLVAYVVTADKVQADTEQWRAHLAASLPAYMLPAAYVQLDALPLNTNNKLDRNALPAPDRKDMAAPSYVAPKGGTEQALASLWQGLLGVQQVGRQDDFFRLGGHSLLSVKLVSAIRERFSCDLPLATVFSAPTLADMARAILLAKLSQYSESDVIRLASNIEGLSQESLTKVLDVRR